MRIAIVGAGSWATGIGAHLSDRNVVTIYARDPKIVESILWHNSNPKYLPGVELPASLRATIDPVVAFEGADLIVIAVPAQMVRESLYRLNDAYNTNPVPVLSLTKGIETGSGLRVSEVITDSWAVPRRRIAVLSGPNHAEEIARKKYAMAVIAGHDSRLVEDLQKVFTTDALRIYASEDLVGVELCGAMKNVLAIAAGICDGREYGDNAKAAIVTRGLAEMARLVQAFSGHPMTCQGQAGAGDLMATCYSPHGRNREVGLWLGKGLPLEVARTKIKRGMVAEGLASAGAIVELAKARKVELPLCEAVADIVNGLPVHEAVIRLMTREPTTESWT